MRTVDAAGLAIGDEHPPRIMGVLNVSPESPYDPSVYDDPGEAAAYVDEALIGEGADIVDVGLESANKRFEVLSAEQELERLNLAVEAVESTSGDAVFSIETRYAEVADAALSRGFEMVNDVCGFADPEMPRVCADHGAAVVKMASPPDLQRPGAVEDVDDIYAALERGGFTDRTIVDPAFGGWSEDKTLADDRETLRRLREFRGLARPILVSINRKNFLKDVVGRDTEGALPASLAATSMAVERGAHVVRTHDVAETRDAALVGRAFARERARAGGSGRRGGRAPVEEVDATVEEVDATVEEVDATVEEVDVTVEEVDVTTPREAGRHADRLGAAVEPADCVARVVEVSGLAPAQREALADAAAEAGAVFAPGSGDDAASEAGADGAGATGDEPTDGLLVGTVAALSRTGATLADHPETAGTALADLGGLLD